MRRFKDDEAQVFISTDAGGVGLNLQSGSALINLDIPWNPAVLEQRIARIHRLGQKNTVQIIKLVAEDSYEVSVLGMVMNKQNLFDNVIDPEATEDVVGVSKRMLDALIESLGEEAQETGPGPETGEADGLDLEAAPETEAVEVMENDAVAESVEDIGIAPFHNVTISS